MLPLYFLPPVVLFGLGPQRVRSQSVQDYWTFPSSPDYSSNIEINTTTIVSWSSNLADQFATYCDKCDTFNVDLWMCDQDCAPGAPIATGIDVAETTAVSFMLLNTPTGLPADAPSWAFYFVPGRWTVADGLNSSVASPRFDISDPNPVPSPTNMTTTPGPTTTMTVPPTTTTTATVTPTPPVPTPLPTPDPGLSTGAKIGIGIGGAIGAIMLVGFGVMAALLSRRSKKTTGSYDASGNYGIVANVESPGGGRGSGVPILHPNPSPKSHPFVDSRTPTPSPPLPMTQMSPMSTGGQWAGAWGAGQGSAPASLHGQAQELSTVPERAEVMELSAEERPGQVAELS